MAIDQIKHLIFTVELILVIFLQFNRHTLSIAIRFIKAKTPEQRAAVDLDTHYSKVTTALKFVCHFVTSLEYIFFFLSFESVGHFALHELSYYNQWRRVDHSNFKVAGATLTITMFNNVQEYLEEYVGSTTRRAILYQVRMHNLLQAVGNNYIGCVGR